MPIKLEAEITENGLNQGDLVRVLKNLRDVVNELQTDHATNKTAMDNRNTSLANFKTIYDAHTHTADGNAARTSLPDTGSPVGSPSAASAFTVTTASNAAGLTESTAITLLRG